MTFFESYKKALVSIRSGDFKSLQKQLLYTDLTLLPHVSSGGSTQIITLGQHQNIPDSLQLIKDCVNAFFQDLTRHCTEHPFVLLIDDYDRINFKNHFLQFFFESYVLDPNIRPEKLIIVMTSSELVSGDFSEFADNEYKRISELLSPMGQLSEKDIEECMKKRGLKKISAKDRYTLHHMQTFRQTSLTDIMAVIDGLKESK